MNKDLKHIDEFVKKHLDGFESSPSTNHWARLSWMLFLRKFKVWLGLGIILLSIGIAYLILFPGNSDLLSFNKTKNKSNISSSNLESNYHESEKVDNVSIDINKSENNNEIVNSEQTISQINDESQLESGLESSSSQKSSILNNDPQDANYTKTNNTEIAVIAVPISEDFKSSQTNKENINSISSLSPLYHSRIEYHKDKSHLKNIASRQNLLSLSTIPTPEEPSEKSGNYNKWSVDFFANPVYNIQTLSADASYQDYIDYRENNEESCFSINFGAEAKYSLGNFFIQSGVNYSDYKQKYNYTHFDTSSFNQLVIDTSWIWVVDPPYIYPYPVSIDSSVNTIYETTMSTVSGTQQYQYIEIPLILGYQFNTYKINIEFGTGISYGLYLSSKGEIPDLAQTQFIDLNSQKDQFQNIFNFHFYVGLDYRLNDKLGIIVKPNFKRNLNSMYNRDFPLEQKFTTFGIAFGLRIQL